MTRASKQQSWLFVEVLQNGIPMATTQCRLGHRKTLRLTDSEGCPLSLPFYPLIHDIDLFQVRGKATRLLLNEPWQGYLHLRGEPQRLNPHQRGERVFELHPGDFGSIVWQDLRVVFKVGKPHKVVGASYSSKESMRGRFGALFFKNRQEVISMGASLAAAAVIILGLTGLIRSLNLHRPTHFDELPSQFTLPFVDPIHILTSPEALQFKLDRNQFVRGSINYYSALAEMLTNPEGPAPERKELMYASSIRLHQKALSDQRAEIKQVMEEQVQNERTAKARSGAGLLAVPAVVGESASGMATRVLDKIGIVHESLQLQERERLLASAEHGTAKPPNDSDFKRPVDPAEKGTSGKMEALGSGGRAMAGVVSNAEHMALVATQLAKQATYSQSRLRSQEDESTQQATRTVMNTLALERVNPSLTFLPDDTAVLGAEGIPPFHAATYGEHKPQAIREPLVGEIDPKRIEEVISRHRYQLQLCFESGLRRQNDLNGSMEWRWRIDTRGDISELNLLSSTISDTGVVSCMRDKISKWRFPRPRRGAVEIRYPFEFSPSKG